MDHSFEGLGLEPRMVATLGERGYTTPTPIQAALIPTLLEGKDAIGKAPTGTGKTAAFSLPAIQRLVPGGNHVQILVLAPTRELAIQVADTMYEYGKGNSARVLPVYGGQSYSRQIGRLRKGIDVVVGTPGRLLDLCSQGALDLSQVSMVVLDEADEMLSMGFVEDIETLLDQTSPDRQTVLMSATMPSRIRSLAKKYMRDAVSHSVEANRKNPLVRQRAYLVNRRDKVAAVARLFETEEIQSCLIFAKTQLGTEDLAAQLNERSIPAKALHGGMGQDVRMRIIRQFREGGIKVLVGTDVAARGLDVDDISHVINFELPADPEVYVHRIGRTGRAGRSGEAITVLAPNEIGKVRRVERFTGQAMERPELPSVEDIEKLRSERLMQQMGVWIERGRCHAERAIINGMVEAGGDPVEIAAAALRMARRAEYERPIESIGQVERRRPARSDSYKGSNSSGRYGRRDGSGERGGRDGGRREGGRDGGRRESGRFGDGPRPRMSNGSRGETSSRQGSDTRRAESRSGGGRSSRDGAMVRLVLSAGKESGIQVNNVVSTVARHGGIPADAIGRVTIEDNRTTVDVRESEAKRVLNKSGVLRFGPQRLDVTLG